MKMQLVSELRAGESLRRSTGIDWRTVLVVPAGNDEDYSDFDVPVIRIPRVFIGRLARRLFLWEYVRREAGRQDVVLVRHSVVDPFETLLIRRLGNVGVVHHTKSAEELLETGHPFLSRVEALLLRADRRWGRWPIGVTAELSKYARGSGCLAASDMVFPNGIELGQFEDHRTHARLESEVHALFVASKFHPWHGLDRLLDALRTWIPKADQHLTVHLVGGLSAAQVAAVQSLCLAKVDFQIHGRLDTADITGLSTQVDVGIGSLALDRNGMTEACTLKVREYLAVGLPVYAGHRDSGLPDDFPYYMSGESTDIARLMEFVARLRGVSRDAVRLAAEDYISKEAIMRRAADGMLREIGDRTSLLKVSARETA